MLRSTLLLGITLGWITPPYLAQSTGDELEQIEISVEDFVFDALAAGPQDGELVLLLKLATHGATNCQSSLLLAFELWHQIKEGTQ